MIALRPLATTAAFAALTSLAAAPTDARAAAWTRTVPAASCTPRYGSTTVGGALVTTVIGYWCPLISDTGWTGSPKGSTTSTIWLDFWSKAEGTTASVDATACWAGYTGAMVCNYNVTRTCTSQTTGCDLGVPSFPSPDTNAWTYYSVLLDNANDNFILKGIGFGGNN